jgi:hypothetical protein
LWPGILNEIARMSNEIMEREALPSGEAIQNGRPISVLTGLGGCLSDRWAAGVGSSVFLDSHRVATKTKRRQELRGFFEIK